MTAFDGLSSHRPIDPETARRQVAELHRLAMDACQEALYATMEQLLIEAVNTAEQLDDLPLLIEERFWLASAQRMQGRAQEAITTYVWLIGLATDPAAGRDLPEDTLWYLAGSFMNFAEVGRFLPEMSARELLQVAADGLAWLEAVGKREWAAGLRMQRGLLLDSQGDLVGARRELEAALALKRRNPAAPGYPLFAYLLHLADLLCRTDVGAYDEGVALAHEALSLPNADIYSRRWTYTSLAYSYLNQGDLQAAADAGQESLTLARGMESAEAAFHACEVLGRIAREMGDTAGAVRYVAEEWRWARKDGLIEYRFYALASSARVRWRQAREACRLEVGGDAVPAELPAGADRGRAQRYLRSLRRFVGWARSLAAELDRATGRRTYQDELDVLIDNANSLDALIGGG